MRYIVRPARTRPAGKGEWDGSAWGQADVLELAYFRPESSDHRPRTRAKLLYDHEGIYGIFRVEDRYVRCAGTAYMSPVCRDSCVEFFVQPEPGGGYFNFEFNCGGGFLCSYITDPERVPGGFKSFTPLPEEDGRAMTIYHSIPGTVEPEIPGPVTWTIEFFIPFSLMEKYAGPAIEVSGREWRANFYKCADATSHPHWASWSPIAARNFHLPGCFGIIEFLK